MVQLLWELKDSGENQAEGGTRGWQQVLMVTSSCCLLARNHDIHVPSPMGSLSTSASPEF